MRRIFGGLSMPWWKVIVLAVIVGIYTGLMMLVGPFEETSLQDIGISYECWVVLAVIIVVNCHEWWDAALKCFIFFLISQPIIYLVQILAGGLSLEMAWMFYRSMWLPMTFLTLPGGLIAYYCKKENVPGGIILGIGNTMQLALGVAYTAKAIQAFPHHLLTAIFCFVSIPVMSFSIHREKKYQWLSILTAVVLFGLLLIFLKVTGRSLY